MGFCEGAPYRGVRSTEQNSLRATKDKREREHVYEISGLGQVSDQRGNKHDENQYHGNLCQLALLLGRERFAVTFCHFDDHEQGDEQNN